MVGKLLTGSTISLVLAASLMLGCGDDDDDDAFDEVATVVEEAGEELEEVGGDIEEGLENARDELSEELADLTEDDAEIEDIEVDGEVAKVATTLSSDQSSAAAEICREALDNEALRNAATDVSEVIVEAEDGTELARCAAEDN